ncbi:MAG: sigma 54-interacting transcriptional regulator [Candidatus Cloacimonetes bacterium]|nr:sigma 54-interacting transcriptional regulator [Candidatus Cloacimonadota bacterium]
MSEEKNEQISKIFTADTNSKPINSYLKALKSFERSGDKDKIIQSYYEIGVKYGLLYNNRKALEYFFLTFNATSEKENLKSHINSAANIGRIFYNIGNIEKALEFLFYALKFYQSISDKLNIAKILRDIAGCYNDSKMYDKALEYNFKAIDIYESLDNKTLMSGTINDTAITYYFLDDYDAALESFFKALKIQKKDNYFFGQGISENNIGEIYYKQEKYEDALKYFYNAIESYKDVKEYYLRATIYLNIGKVYKRIKKYNKALENLSIALKISEDNNMKKNQPEILIEMKEIYFDSGKFKKAYEVQEKYYQLKDDILQETKKIEKEDFQKEQLKDIECIATDEKIKDEPIIIGISEEMKEVFSLINIISEHNVNVLITGPTGCGKELIARRVHRNFKCDSPFIAINCSAIPEHLLESELFGHTKGAFTGAIKNKKGKIEQANNGTLFLDEIGDMNLSLQAKILRVIQERKVTPVGSTKEIPVTVRIISATNKNLEELIESNKFRRDLFYRLNVIRVKIPALKDHKSDIPILVSHFIRKYNKKFNKKIQSISVNALNYLISCEWQGNIRELENEIEKAVLLSTEEILNIDLFAQSNNHTDSSFFEKLPLVWEEYQLYKINVGNKLDSNYVSALMESSDSSIQKASELGKLGRTQVYRLLKKTGKSE